MCGNGDAVVNDQLTGATPGHAIRCIPTPYVDTFETEKRKLRAEGKSPLEIGIALERIGDLGESAAQRHPGLDVLGVLDERRRSRRRLGLLLLLPAPNNVRLPRLRGVTRPRAGS